MHKVIDNVKKELHVFETKEITPQNIEWLYKLSEIYYHLCEIEYESDKDNPKRVPMA